MQLKRIVNAEYKQHAVNSPTNAVDNNGTTPLDLAVIAQGDDATDRDGISIKPINLILRMFITQHASATNTLVRVVIFRGKQENDSAMVLGNIFASTPLLKPKVYDKRFVTKILYDKYFTLSSAGQSCKATTVSLKLHGHINYDTSDATGNDKEGGGLYMVFISNEAINTPNVAYNSRLTFTDN
jgi:hypothetical protein